MARITKLHENYCQLNSQPITQADILEGLAQLITTKPDLWKNLLTLFQQDVFFPDDKLDKNKFAPGRWIRSGYNEGVFLFSRMAGELTAPYLRRINKLFPRLDSKLPNQMMYLLVGFLNGAIGDYLVRSKNPLAISMCLYDQYGQEKSSGLSGVVNICIHGLCMTYTAWWNRKRIGVGRLLCQKLENNTSLYLNYNTGRRISANGRSLSVLLDQIVKDNPNITEINLIGHSMGGLVSRSALFYGKQSMAPWFDKTKKLVCLGSPHHGAMLERLGFMVQNQLFDKKYFDRFAAFVSNRSEGILDLRYGSVRDDDWELLEKRVGEMGDLRRPAPLPAQIKTFLVAGSLENKPSMSEAMYRVGDYLVDLPSALGEHPDPRFRLKVPHERKKIFYGLDHFEVQHHPDVCYQILHWFQDKY